MGSIYRFLNDSGYSHAPKLIGHVDETLILPDLSNWDWSRRWSKSKLDAVLQAQTSLCNLSLSPEIGTYLTPAIGQEAEAAWEKLIDDALWNKVLEKASLFLQVGHDLDKITTDARANIALQIKAKLFECDQLIHADIRHDNCAFDPQSCNLYLLDWNWAELGSGNLDRTGFLISVMLEPASNLETNLNLADYQHLIDPISALALAGTWFSNCTLDPVQPGDPLGLREFQMRNGWLAWCLANIKL